MVNFFRKRLLYKFEMPRHLLGYPDSSKGAQICCYSYQTGLDCFMEIKMHIYIYTYKHIHTHTHTHTHKHIYIHTHTPYKFPRAKGNVRSFGPDIIFLPPQPLPHPAPFWNAIIAQDHPLLRLLSEVGGQ